MFFCARASVKTSLAYHEALMIATGLVLALAGCDAKTRTSQPQLDSAIIPPTADTGPAPSGVDVLTQHNDVSRTGQNLNETTLNTSNVTAATFGKLFTLPLDGYVFAQPLIVTHYSIGGKLHDVVFVATAHNSVYAFDADAGGPPLWTTSLGPSVPSTAILNGLGTKNILVEVGILSTPVIDRTKSLLYVTCETYLNSKVEHSLHVLDLATGAEKPGSPITIAATFPGTGYDAGPRLAFDPVYQSQRGSLLLMNGTVYIPFASHADFQPYHGWILGYRYDPSAETLTQSAVLNTTPDGVQGGIWQSGQGLLSDGTSIYANTGNGAMTAQYDGGASYGESFLRLNPALQVQDWFSPLSYALLNKGDLDVGAGGPILLPGTSPPLILGGGKQGVLYLVDTTNMGHLASGSDKDVQEFPVTNGIYGAPVIWTGGNATRLYFWGPGDVVKQFTFTKGQFTTTPTATSVASIANVPAAGGDPVSNLAISSNGSTPGSGILWAVKPLQNPNRATVPGVLYAFDALSLKELWDSTQVAARDTFGNFAKFDPPTVANGKVYLATASQQLVVYGLLSGG